MDSNNNEERKLGSGGLESGRQTVCEKASDQAKVDTSNEDELERLAVEAILQETKRAKQRAENVGAFGWKKKTLTTNKRYINAVVRDTVNSNRRQLTKDQRRTYVAEKYRKKGKEDEGLKRRRVDKRTKDKRVEKK